MSLVEIVVGKVAPDGPGFSLYLVEFAFGLQISHLILLTIP